MITVLEYLVIAAAIGAVVFVIAVFVFGRGERMAPLPAQTSPAELPDRGITAQDVHDVKLAMALRGYRMGDVDWVLERLALRIDELSSELAELRGPEDSAELVSVPAGGELLAGDEARAALAEPMFPRPAGIAFGSSAHVEEAEAISDELAYGAPPLAGSRRVVGESDPADVFPSDESGVPAEPEPGARHRPAAEGDPS